MKFYLVLLDDERAGVEMSLREAKRRARDESDSFGSVEMIEVDVNAETIRRLISGEGGYARDTRIVYEVTK